MTRQKDPAHENKFVGAILPWLVAVSGLILYLATLSHWLSLNNLFQASRITSPIFTPELSAPVYFLITYPLRWLPAHQAPIAMNILSAVCGALTLALLARSVSLLPHDRTHQQRLREQGRFALLTIREAWIPPVLAAAALAMQLTIWEGATTGAKEMLDLLLFAYVIRCVLEYRISERDRWLFKASLVYGLAMTQNWVMIGLLPAFVFSLIWIRGVSFFNLRFLRGLVFCGFVGCLLYFVLPLIYVNWQHADMSFWAALKVNLKEQKTVLSNLVRFAPGNILLLLAITSLLPLLLMGIRWASHFGDPSPMGIALTTAVFHLSHGLLLGACVWAVFDPAFGPRRMGFGLAPLILTLCYLGAFSIGYFSGYFLLVFIPLKERASRGIAFWKLALHRVSQAVIWLLLVLVPAGLVYKNLPRIRISTGQMLPHFASQLTRNLPENAVVLSDDPLRRFLAEAWSARNGKARDRIFLDTQSLNLPFYFNSQQKLHPDDWLPPTTAKNTERNDPRLLLQLMFKLSEKRPVYYLHPSFGYYFEVFYPQPRGMIYELKRYDTNSIAAPPLTDAEIAENETFWKNNERDAANLMPFIAEPGKGQRLTVRQTFLKKLHIPYEPHMMAVGIGSYYSLALNSWGVQMQTAGKLQEAGQHFQRALALNENNISSQRNLEFNKELQDGVRPAIQDLKILEKDFGKYRNWQLILRDCGPFDEPTHRFAQAMVFGQSGLYRQSIQQFERIVQLVPDYAPARLGLAQLYVMNRLPDKALALIPAIREQFAASADSGVGSYDILKVEATALYSADRIGEAEKLLRESMDKHPKDINMLALVFQISASFRGYTNALGAVEHALKMKPDDVGALVNKGFLTIQIGDFPTAISALSAALAQDTNNVTARIDRAIAYLGNNQLDEAKKDYEILEKILPNAFQVYYGLGEIAWRRQDTNSAFKYYDLYLANAPAGTDEAKTIKERYEGLKAAIAKP